MSQAQRSWLKVAEAAAVLGVSVRTIKGWTRRSDTRAILGVIRHGKQERIPYPENMPLWVAQTRESLRELGRTPKNPMKRALKRLERQFGQDELGSYRLWLAAMMQAVMRGPITRQMRAGIDDLRFVANSVLGKMPRRTEVPVEELRAEIEKEIMARGWGEEGIQAVMSWPDEQFFAPVRAAKTPEELEDFRKRIDYAQAVSELEASGQKPTAENIAPLLHKDRIAHLNDTREQLPGVVVKNPNPEQLQQIILASACCQMAGRKVLPVMIDMTKPQTGLARRTIQKRHPQKGHIQKEIIRGVCRIRQQPAGVDERPDTGKTRVRKPEYEGKGSIGRIKRAH